MPHPALAVDVHGDGRPACQQPRHRHDPGAHRLDVALAVGERHGVAERPVAAGGAAQGGQVRAAAERGAEVVGQRAHVEAGGAVDVERQPIAGEIQQFEVMHRHLHGAGVTASPRRASRWALTPPIFLAE